MLPTVIVRLAAAKIDLQWRLRSVSGACSDVQRMISSQTIRKINAAVHVASKMAARSRTGRALLAGMRATAHSFGRVAHQLWLEVTGFVFLAIALIGASAGMREYEKYQSGHAAGPGRLVLAICFTLSFTWFGLSSFWRVKKRAKS